MKKRIIAGIVFVVFLVALLVMAFNSNGQALKFSAFPVRSAIDSGSYGAGVQNASGVFTNYRFKLKKGTVTSVKAGTGLVSTVNPIIDTGTFSLATTGTAGSYGDTTKVPRITTDTFGRVTGVTMKNIYYPGQPLSTVLSAGNTATTGLKITTPSNELHMSTGYRGFSVVYGTTMMAGLRSSSGTYGYLDLGTANDTATISPELITDRRNFKLPDANGTFALTSQLPSIYTVTFSGNGVATIFAFTAPVSGTVIVATSNATSAAVASASISGTSGSIQFTSAPAVGVNNVKVCYWVQ